MSNNLKIIIFAHQNTYNTNINFKLMTEQERNEIEQQIENLKLIFKFHTENRVIKNEIEFNDYINDILDMIAELEEQLKKE